MGEKFEIHETVLNITDQNKDHNDKISKSITNIQLDEIINTGK